MLFMLIYHNMKKTGFIFDEIFLRHETPKWHPECRERLDVILEALKGSELWNRLEHERPRKARPEELASVHTARHVEKMRSTTGYADPDTFVSPNSYEAAQYAAGAVLKAVELISDGELERAFCAVRPPGHHAEANRAMGFCIFNNIAVGARGAQARGMERVFIADFDVHHGNGTQSIFYDDPGVFFFSTHQYPFYPGTGAESEKGAGKGEGTTFNIPIAAGSGQREYLRAYRDMLPGLIGDFKPDILLVSAGYDIYVNDPLGGMNVTKDALRAIVRAILEASAGVPSVFVLEGGYDLDSLGELVLISLEELLYS